MKGLFKPKIRSPVELVRYSQELLLFIDRNEEVREQKRAEKVLLMFLFIILLKFSSGSLCFHYMLVDFCDVCPLGSSLFLPFKLENGVLFLEFCLLIVAIALINL